MGDCIEAGTGRQDRLIPGRSKKRPPEVKHLAAGIEGVEKG